MRAFDRLTKNVDRITELFAEGIVAAGENNSRVDINKKSDVKYSLKPYSQHLLDNWKNSKKIIVYENQQQFSSFIDNALDNKIKGQKIYFGAIDSALSDFIKNKTGIVRVMI